MSASSPIIISDGDEPEQNENAQPHTVSALDGPRHHAGSDPSAAIPLSDEEHPAGGPTPKRTGSRPPTGGAAAKMARRDLEPAIPEAVRLQFQELQRDLHDAEQALLEARAEIRVLERRKQELEVDLRHRTTSDAQMFLQTQQINDARPFLRCPVCMLTQHKAHILHECRHIVCLPCLEFCFREQTVAHVDDGGRPMDQQPYLVCPVSSCHTILARAPTRVPSIHALAHTFLKPRPEQHFTANVDTINLAQYPSLS